MSKKWWKAAGIRSLKTFCQVIVAVCGTSAAFFEVDWYMVLSTALLAGVLSLLTSVAGLPEVPEEVEENA